ncbi:MAG: flavodoxin domain-containing protein [Candidatus Hodarchaeota archaeon]
MLPQALSLREAIQGMVNEMVKVFIVYDTKYGNTKLVAETIAEGMNEAEGIETTTGDVEETDPEQTVRFDAILIGSPNHFGGPVGGINRFIDKLGKLELKAKWAAVFDTYEGKDYEKAVKKMEKRIGEKIPALKLITAGLSIKVDGTKGPITDGELPKCKEFGKKIANLL